MLASFLRRAARRSSGVIVLVALLTVPAVVVANHQFPDVPNGHPFHNEISVIAGGGITAGFPDGGYHPGDPVTRQAMAAFMERGFGHARFTAGSPTETANVHAPAGQPTTTPVVVRSLAITVPGATNAFSPVQYVMLRGQVTLSSSMSTGGQGCPCEFAASIVDSTNNLFGAEQVQTFESTSATAFERTLDVEVLYVAPPGPLEFELLIRLSGRASQVSAATFTLDPRSSFSATTFPFELVVPDPN